MQWRSSLVRVRGCPTPSPLHCPPMLRLHVTHQRPTRHLLPALPELYPSPLTLPVQGALSRHPSPVRHRQLCPFCLAWAADHANGLPDISPQTHPVKQSDQGAKISLDPSRVQRCNDAIIRAEEVILMPTLFSTLARLFCALHRHCHPVTHYCTHHHVENGGG